MELNDVRRGCLIGQAIGDMMGLPFENLPKKRIARLAKFDRPQFFFGYGCGSDDTEHAGLTFDAVQFATDDVKLFEMRLASNLRRWFLAGPPGIGLATLKACVKLCLGVSPKHSGVRSAGNGPAMRAAILGVTVPAGQLKEFVDASSRLTHTDERSLVGAEIIARLASVAGSIIVTEASTWLKEVLVPFKGRPELEPLLKNVSSVIEELSTNLSVTEFAAKLCGPRGVSGFIAHTVPVAVFAFFRHADDYAEGIRQVIRCGGDTDTVAAITGALIGTRVGVEGIPVEWRQRHRDWPWSLKSLIRGVRPPLVAWPLTFLRNMAFFVVVLVHLARRVLPPW
jgi:ADP-ribosyl-[dinitrogen reductase] hydrolase